MNFDLLPLGRGLSTFCMRGKLNSGICILLHTIILKPNLPLEQSVSCTFSFICYNEVQSPIIIKTSTVTPIKNALKYMPYVRCFVLLLFYRVNWSVFRNKVARRIFDSKRIISTATIMNRRVTVYYFREMLLQLLKEGQRDGRGNSDFRTKP
jgi:hypothetical protein